MTLKLSLGYKYYKHITLDGYSLRAHSHSLSAHLWYESSQIGGKIFFLNFEKI